MLLVTALWFSLAFLVGGAVVGVVLMAGHLKGTRVPVPLAVLHGVAALLGTGLLAVAAIGARGQAHLDFGIWPNLSIAVLVAAAIGGVVLFVLHLQGRRLPGGLMGAHAAIAAIGIAFVTMLVVIRIQTAAPVPLDPTQPAPLPSPDAAQPPAGE